MVDAAGIEPATSRLRVVWYGLQSSMFMMVLESESALSLPFQNLGPGSIWSYLGATPTTKLIGYPQASRQIATDTNTGIIDLNAMSKTMFEAMGKEGADRAFMKFKAGSYPGVERDISDTTHFNNFGAYELARCIVHGIREDKMPIASFLDPSVPDFDPNPASQIIRVPHVRRSPIASTMGFSLVILHQPPIQLPPSARQLPPTRTSLPRACARPARTSCSGPDRPSTRQSDAPGH